MFKKRDNYKGQLNILFLSNLIISKGYLDLLDALFILDKSNVKYQCVFAGEIYKSPDDPNNLNIKKLKENFLNKINRLKFPENVNFLGRFMVRKNTNY